MNRHLHLVDASEARHVVTGPMPPIDGRFIGRTSGSDPHDLELRSVLGRFEDAITRWGMDGVDVRALLALPDDVVPEVGALALAVVASVEGESRLRRIVDIDVAVATLLGDEAACREWLRTPNAGLRHRRPVDLLRGEGDVVRAIRDALRAEARAARPGWAL